MAPAALSLRVWGAGNDMRDADCAAFLQWALPRLGLAWEGYRKVRGQVCKRIRRRMRAVGDPAFGDYRRRLERDEAEWDVLDSLCHITISRFCRDGSVFDVLAAVILPAIAERAAAEGRQVGIWSAGCASGEEPHTLRMLWDLRVRPASPGASASIVATDLDETMLARASRGCYPAGSLRELPPDLIERAFTSHGGCFCLRREFRDGVCLLRQDLRREAPPGPFDLVVCRNLAFTYFSPSLQKRVLERLVASLRPQGVLVIGAQERLPTTIPELERAFASSSIFVRAG